MVCWTGDQYGSWDLIRYHIPTLIGGLPRRVRVTPDRAAMAARHASRFSWEQQAREILGLMGVGGRVKDET